MQRKGVRVVPLKEGDLYELVSEPGTVWEITWTCERDGVAFATLETASQWIVASHPELCDRARWRRVQE